MDLKCSNCGQFITDKDRFCKYCGAPNPAVHKEEESEKKPKIKSKRQLDDETQKSKTVITEADYEGAGKFDTAKLELVPFSDILTMQRRNNMFFAFSIILAILSFVAVVLIFTLWDSGNELAKSILAILLMLLCLFCCASSFHYGNAKKFTFNTIDKDNDIIFSTKLNKEPYYKKGLTLYRIVFPTDCPFCKGEIRGDLHIEKIENRYILVCNYNRKHFFVLDMDELSKRFED